MDASRERDVREAGREGKDKGKKEGRSEEIHYQTRKTQGRYTEDC